VSVAIDHASPNEHTGTVQGLLAVIGVLALAASMFCRIKAVNWSKYGPESGSASASPAQRRYRS